MSSLCVEPWRGCANLTLDFAFMLTARQNEKPKAVSEDKVDEKELIPAE